MKYIIRADFYPDGRIMPLGVTDDCGNTSFIKKIIKVEKISLNKYKFYCITDNGDMLIIYNKGEWRCIKNNIQKPTKYINIIP